MSPFTWIRTATRNAVLGGIQDAIDEVAANPEAITLRVELPAIAAPVADEDADKPRTRAKGGKS
jgi:hypothetical protein